MNQLGAMIADKQRLRDAPGLRRGWAFISIAPHFSVIYCFAYRPLTEHNFQR
jgi:hypothetical protein